MKMKFFIFSIVLSVVLSEFGFAQTVETRGRVSNSVYFLERSDVDASTGATQVSRIYQFLRFSAGIKEYKNLTLNVSARALTDSEADLSDEDRFRAYRLSLSASRLFNGLLDFEVGRQFLHPGIPFGSLDGLNLLLRPLSKLEWQVFGGIESHLQRSFKLYELDDATVFGSAVKYRDFYKSDIQLAYLHKRSRDVDQWQIAGLNISNRYFDPVCFLVQAHYDLVNERFHRLYFSTRYTATDDLHLFLRLKQQYPQIYGDSFFRIFELNAYRQAGVGANYSLSDNYAVGANYNLIQLEEGSGHRIVADISNRNGSIGIVYETGDLGDQLGLLFDYGYEIIPDLIASLSIDYSRYRFEEIYDYESQLANALRVTYNFTRHLRADLEYQWLNNRFKDSDQRLLNHIHYIW
jgi:hypothetical protein